MTRPPYLDGRTKRANSTGMRTAKVDKRFVDTDAFSIDSAIFYRSSGSGQTIANDTKTLVTFIDSQTSSDDFYTAGNTPLAHDAGETAPSKMYWYRPGWYYCFAVTTWEAGSYPKLTQLAAGSGTGSSGVDGMNQYAGNIDDAYIPTGLTGQNPFADGVLSENPLDTSLSVVHRHAYLVFVGSLEGITTKRLVCQVWQKSGSDKKILRAKLGVIRIGHYDAPYVSAP